MKAESSQSQYPLSFAVQAAPAKHAHEWVSLARRSEDLGYRALLVPDHQGSGGPIVGMAVAGASTTALKVGSLVIAVDFHNPVVLTQELMTLSALVDGRLEVGLGAGWMDRDYKRAGVSMEPATARIDKLVEFVAVVKKLWSGGATSHVGTNYRCEEAVCAPELAGDAPCLILGGGGRRMVQAAAELASIVNLGASMAAGSKAAPLGNGASLKAFDRRVGWVRGISRRRGYFPELQCLAYETCITPNADAYIEKYVCDSFGIPPVEVLRSPLALVGTIDAICEKIQYLREHLGISYWVVKSPVMDDFAPVVSRLAGT